MQEPIVEEIEVGSDLQKRFVNIANTRSRTPRDERPHPADVRVSQRARAE